MATNESRKIRYDAGEVKRNAFYKFPKYLLLDPEYKSLAATAKIAYAVLKDRHQLSMRNKMVDNAGHVYVIFSREEMQSVVGVSKNTVTKIMQELNRFGLLEEVRQGQGKPNRIYLLAPENSNMEEPEDPVFTPCGDGFRLPNKDDQAAQQKADKAHNDSADRHTNGLLASYSKTDISNTEESEREAEPMATAPEDSKTAPPLPNKKETFGDLFQEVKLHQGEYDLLIKMYTSDVVRDYINRLDAHVASTGRKYQNHYATISKWIQEDSRKAEKKPKLNRFINFEQRDNTKNFAVLEKAEIALRTGNKAMYDDACRDMNWDITSDANFENLCRQRGHDVTGTKGGINENN